MTRLKINILFFTWLEIYSFNNKINYFFKQTNLDVHTSHLRKCKIKNHGTIQSIHPPLKSINLNISGNHIPASPFKLADNRHNNDPFNLGDIKKIY